MKSLVLPMLRSFVDVDGEALVMHAGDKPYVVGPAGQVELANHPLTMEAVKGIVSQLLPDDVARALDEFGAVQHEIVSPPEFPRESFMVVAARGSDDMWVEIRRRKMGHADGVFDVPIEPTAQRLAIAATVRRGAEAARLRRPTVTAQPTRSAPPARPAPEAAAESPVTMSEMVSAPPPLPPLAPITTTPSAPPTPLRTPQHEPVDPIAVPLPAVVVPMPRGPQRPESAESASPSIGSGLDHLLRIAAGRGASTLYLSSNAPPSARIDGEVRILEGEPTLGPQEVESLLLAAVPDAKYESLRSGSAVDWTSNVDGVGRVRCTTFQDRQGAGGVFRMVPARAVSAERFGLQSTVESLALEPAGLVLVTGPRLSGKRTLIAALIDVINRRRRDHVIAIESEIAVAHGPGTSIVSHREVRGGSGDVERAARTALREDPDVLVLESLQSAGLIDIALEGAASGHLVIGGLSARDTASAVDRIVNSCPADARQQMRLTLAEHLRGIVAQVLLPKKGGGRVAAREILVNTPTVASVIAEGRLSELARVIDTAHGMQRLNDVLAGLVQKGTVEITEAYRRAVDRAGLLAELKRLGVDTSAIR